VAGQQRENGGTAAQQSGIVALYDLSGKLMAGNGGEMVSTLGVYTGDVTAANAASTDLQKDLVLCNLGHSHLLIAQVTDSVQNGCIHHLVVHGCISPLF
jgi:hypothetical protein